MPTIGVALTILVALAVFMGSENFVTAEAAPIPDAAPTARPTAMPTPTAPPDVATDGDDGEKDDREKPGAGREIEVDVREGRDYRLQTDSRGRPLRWPCSVDIPVVIEGTPPDGAHDALQLVIDRIREASRLPLVVGTAHQVNKDGAGAIRIRYVAEGESAYGMSLSGNAVGRGGPTSINGIIQSGRIIVRNDMDPTTPKGRLTLMHEIAHALGLLHADEGVPEVMVPTSTPDAQPVLGPGDRAALNAVGC